MTVLLAAEQLTIGYGKQTIGRNINLALQSNEILALLGPNGSGKTTTKPLAALFRSVSALPALKESIVGNPDRLTAAELATAARPVLDAHYAEQIQDFHRLYEERTGQQRTTTDISDAARLATFGGIDRLPIDIDGVIDGYIDDETGEVTFAGSGDAVNYGIVDEITGRALRTGAKVMAVRKADIPGGHDLAVISRYPI